jgi:hypothetical protein
MNRVHGNNNNCDNKSEIERVQRLWLRLAVVPVKMVRSQQEVLSTNTELDRRLQSITMSLLCISILRGCLKMMRCRFYCNRVLLQQGSTATGFYCNRVLLQQVWHDLINPGPLVTHPLTNESAMPSCLSH